MNGTRFLNAIAMVERLPEKQLQIDQWWLGRGCHTVGCVCGHYAHQHPDEFLPPSVCGVQRLDGRWMELEEWADYFELTLEKAIYVFSPNSYLADAPKQVVLDRMKEIACRYNWEVE